MTDVTTYDPPAVLATVLGVHPKQLMDYAIEVSNTLSSVLRDRGMTRKFGAGEHVQSEGWQLAGSLMGFVVDEGECKELPDGSYEATAVLKSFHTGRVIASASSRCGVDEPTWRGKPKYARRSMAYTRAIGRVYAQNFRWLIRLAGYETTPSEEMVDVKVELKPEDLYRPFNLDDNKWLARELGNYPSRSYTKEDMRVISTSLSGRPKADLSIVISEFEKKGN